MVKKFIRIKWTISPTHLKWMAYSVHPLSIRHTQCLDKCVLKTQIFWIVFFSGVSKTLRSPKCNILFLLDRIRNVILSKLQHIVSFKIAEPFCGYWLLAFYHLPYIYNIHIVSNNHLFILLNRPARISKGSNHKGLKTIIFFGVLFSLLRIM